MKNIINRIKNDKVLFFLSILIIGVFLVLVIRITYSYLAAYINEAGESATLSSDTVDEFKFIEGDKLDLNVTPTTLPEGGGNYSQSTTYGASLLANSTNNTAEESYYVYFNVTANTLGYIQEGNPEVILTVFQGETEITNIDGLTYGTYNGVTGFDVTTATGMFTVASDYAITSNSSTDATVQNWTFTLTYLNQNYDQSGNYGNNMNVEFIMTKEERTVTLADYVISQYTGTDGENGLYYHDADLANSAADNSYRYAGASANVNNYVCFGDDCSNEDNLYRIIGVFDNEVKLIKATSYGDYVWDADIVNTWDATTKPDIYTTLNDTYYNSLGTTWQNKIADATWQVGGFPDTYYNDSLKTNYDYEVGVNQTGYEETMKIGLMYVGDYVYASGSNNWTASLYDYGRATDPNEGWLYLGVYEWTISRSSGYSNGAWFVYSDGYLDSGGDYVNGAHAVRPSFYLTSSTTYVSGSGAATDPIVIN